MNEQLKILISEILPTAVFDETGEWLNVAIDAKDWRVFANELRYSPGFNMDYLFCVTGVDWKTHLSVVYHLTSTTRRHTIVVKAKVDRENPAIETVSDIWRTAEFHEREVYDFFGIEFLHHPDLRRLFLTDDWKGWPLRKDYDDPVNIIKL